MPHRVFEPLQMVLIMPGSWSAVFDRTPAMAAAAKAPKQDKSATRRASFQNGTRRCVFWSGPESLKSELLPRFRIRPPPPCNVLVLTQNARLAGWQRVVMVARESI